LRSSGRLGEVTEPIRRVVGRAVERLGPTAAESYRDIVVEALRQGPARALPDAEAVLRASRVGDTARPLLDALERFDAIAALPPGRSVNHTGFGAGRVVSNDGEIVVLDFAHARA